MISSITIPDLLTKGKDVKIIDTRSVESYNNNHIPNAINIPQELLLIEPQKHLNMNEVYYIYCQKGLRSIKTCNILRSKGYKVVHVIGGYEGWILQK